MTLGRLAVVALVSVSATSGQTRGAVARDVCRVLGEREFLSGKVIVVRGILIETMEWSAIEAVGCPTIRLNGVDWPASIEAVSPKDAEAPGFLLSFQRLRKSVEGARKAGRSGAVVATFVGRLVTKELSAITLKNGTVVRFGFGHLGAFPARLVLNSVQEVVVEP